MGKIVKESILMQTHELFLNKSKQYSCLSLTKQFFFFYLNLTILIWQQIFLNNKSSKSKNKNSMLTFRFTWDTKPRLIGKSPMFDPFTHSFVFMWTLSLYIISCSFCEIFSFYQFLTKCQLGEPPATGDSRSCSHESMSHAGGALEMMQHVELRLSPPNNISC